MPGIIDNNLEPQFAVLDPTDVGNYPDPRGNQSFILRIDEIYAGRSGSHHPGGSLYPRNYVRKFRVILNPSWGDIETIDDTDILNDGRIPRPFASFVSNWSNLGLADISALATRFYCEREFTDDPGTWIVTVDYSLDVGEGGPDFRFMFAGTQFGQDLIDPNNPMYKPWYQLPVFEYGSIEATTAMQFDLNGDPFVNSAGDPIVPAPSFEIAYPTLSITRNEASFTPQTVSQWAYSLNQNSFMGYPSGCVQLLPPTAKVLWYGNIKYYRVTWKMRFKLIGGVVQTVTTFGNPVTPVTWQPLILDAGFYQLVPALAGGGFVSVPIYRGGSRTSNVPSLLNGVGEANKINDPPVYIQFEVYPYRDFTQLFNNSMSP